MRENSRSILEFSEELATASGIKTYVIHTRSEQIIPGSLFEEAQAVCEFLVEKEIKSITLIGYSQGSIKAIDTAFLLLEKGLFIQVEGLILIDPVGLNDISNVKLVRSYVVDSLITSPLVQLRESARKASLRRKSISLIKNAVLSVNIYIAFLLALMKEVKISQFKYFSRFKNQLKEMSQQSPYIGELSVPIILILGTEDRVSDNYNILSQARVQPALTELHDTTANSFISFKKKRKETLATCLFPRSPHVSIVNAKKFGSHLLPLLRSKAVARASLYLLRRCYRSR